MTKSIFDRNYEPDFGPRFESRRQSDAEDNDWSFGRFKNAWFQVVLIGCCFILFALFFASEPNSETSRVSPLEWHQGGTLHDATVVEWNSASDRDRLATAADWTTRVIGRNEFERVGLSGLRIMATALVVCIDAAAAEIEGEVAEAASALLLGASCMVMMGW